VFRRWSASLLWRRLYGPIRRLLRQRRDAALCAPYTKQAEPSGQGIVAAIGDFSGDTGLSRAALYELDLLRQEHGEIEVLHIDPVAARKASASQALAGPPIGVLYILLSPDSYSAVLPLLPPDRIAGAYRVGLWVWETPFLPSSWRPAFDIVNEVFTPSEYCRRAIAAKGCDLKIRLRPHPVKIPDAVQPLDRASLGVAHDAFLGLAAMDLRSCPARKNPWAHIAAWQAAFGADPRSVLILKVRFSRQTQVVRDELREMIGATANIRLLEEHLAPERFLGLQAAADVFLSLHRAEGYGLLIREMLELGRPVVATDWSANAEYGPFYAAYRGVPYRLVPYRDWLGHFSDGKFLWAEADIDAAAAALRDIAQDRCRSAATPESSDASEQSTCSRAPERLARL
jgi:glycosyltransferase involved in cell wall biosynthesis